MLYRFWRLSRQRKKLLCAASGHLLLAAYRVRYQPWSRLVATFGAQGQETPVTLNPTQLLYAREVEWAVAAVCRRLVPPPTCLMQALAAKALLRRRQIPATLYIGVAPSQANRPINAHAWLRCGRRIITGKATQQDFRPMAWYG